MLRTSPSPSQARSRSHTPLPKFKYLADPAAHGRDYAYRQSPFEGDFCIVSLDHVASVAHLGDEAKEAAKRKAIEEEAERKRKVKAAVSGRSKRTPFNYDQVSFTLHLRCCISIHICARDYRRNLRSSQPLQTLPQLQIIWSTP